MSVWATVLSQMITNQLYFYIRLFVILINKTFTHPYWAWTV
jgi:hypothetical protein